jgi:chromosome segregation ATPase
MKIDNQNNMSNEIDNILSPLKEKFNSAINDLEKQLSNHLNEMSQKIKEVDDWKAKYQEAQSKVEHIENQLSNTVKKLEEMNKEQSKEINALELLDVYLILMEQVFESAPHVRLLLMLHGEKDEYTVNELVQGSGIGGLNVKKAIHELRNANVLEFDEENEIVKLRSRFLN